MIIDKNKILDQEKSSIFTGEDHREGNDVELINFNEIIREDRNVITLGTIGEGINHKVVKRSSHE